MLLHIFVLYHKIIHKCMYKDVWMSFNTHRLNQIFSVIFVPKRSLVKASASISFDGAHSNLILLLLRFTIKKVIMYVYLF